MDEFVTLLLGIGILAIVPAVPLFRRVGKLGVKGGLVVVDSIRQPVAAVGNNWRGMVNEARAETNGGARESGAGTSATSRSRSRK